MELTVELAATGLGLAAAGMLVGCPLIASLQRVLQVQILIGVAFALHFLLLGILPAAAMNILAAVQSAAALAAIRRPSFGMASYGIIPLMWAAGALFWSGPLTVLAVLAMTVVALARLMAREIPMRVTFLAGSALWFAHDALAGAWIPLCADLLCGAMGLGMIMQRLGASPVVLAQAAAMAKSGLVLGPRRQGSI
jgi:hypothetical protein